MNQGPRVLIIDNSRVTRLILQISLRRAGSESVACAGGREVSTALRLLRFPCLLPLALLLDTWQHLRAQGRRFVSTQEGAEEEIKKDSSEHDAADDPTLSQATFAATRAQEQQEGAVRRDDEHLGAPRRSSSRRGNARMRDSNSPVRRQLRPSKRHLRRDQ